MPVQAVDTKKKLRLEFQSRVQLQYISLTTKKGYIVAIPHSLP